MSAPEGCGSTQGLGKLESLTPKIKQQLFNLTNYVIRQNEKRYRMISAVGRMTESFARGLTRDGATLELPELIPLESYRYE